MLLVPKHKILLFSVNISGTFRGSVPQTLPQMEAATFTFQIKCAAMSLILQLGQNLSFFFFLGLNTKADQDVCLIIPILTAVIFVLFWLSFSMLEVQQHQ